MLTGRPPFIADSATGDTTAFAIKKAHIDTQPIPPRKLNSSVPMYINDIITFALQKKPENRLPGCQEFLRLLNEDSEKVDAKKNGFRWDYFFAFLLVVFWLVLISSLLIK